MPLRAGCPTRSRRLFFFVVEVVVGRGEVWPELFDALVRLAIIFRRLQILDDFERDTRPLSVIDELILSGGPGRVLEIRGEFECPVHTAITLGYLSPEVPIFNVVRLYLQESINARMLMGGSVMIRLGSP